VLQTPVTELDLRPSLAERLLVAFAAGFLALITLAIAALGLFAAASSILLAAILLPLAAFMGLMAWIVLREARAVWTLSISIDGSTVRLRLPAIRGYVAQGALDSWIPLASIACIDSREEAFRSIGTTAIQRAYAVVLRDGSRTVLGADRPMKTPFFQTAAIAIAAKAKVPLHDLGIVDGHAGPVLVSGNTAPDWSAASLPAPLARKRRNAAAMTYTLIGAVFVLIIVLRLALHLI
jgi:hypothetical protein